MALLMQGIVRFGSNVVNAGGEEIGRITAFRGGQAYVDPDPDLGNAIGSKLGWGEVDDQGSLSGDHIETVTDDEVRLSRL